MQTPLSRERRLPCCLTATVGVFMTAARPQSEAQEEEAFGREGDGTGGGVPAGLKECGRKCGLLKTWAQPQAPAAGSREPTGAHRSILGQRRPPLPLGKPTRKASEQKSPWRIAAISISCRLLPNMRKCPLQVSPT